MNFEKFRTTQWQYMYVGAEAAKIEFLASIMLAILYHHQLSISRSSNPDQTPETSSHGPEKRFFGGMCPNKHICTSNIFL
jgi:hypothetical protein